MNRIALLPFIALVAAATVSCSSSPLVPSEVRELDRAEARWAARPFRAYSIEMKTSCFCPPIINEWARVEVVNDSVTRVVLVDSGVEVNSVERASFRTVESVFDAIRSSQRSEWVKDVVAHYDPLLGFPTYVSFIPKDGILDAGSVHYLRNAAALPGH
jgi:hypothetical protein